MRSVRAQRCAGRAPEGRGPREPSPWLRAAPAALSGDPWQDLNRGCGVGSQRSSCSGSRAWATRAGLSTLPEDRQRGPGKRPASGGPVGGFPAQGARGWGREGAARGAVRCAQAAPGRRREPYGAPPAEGSVPPRRRTSAVRPGVGESTHPGPRERGPGAPRGSKARTFSFRPQPGPLDGPLARERRSSAPTARNRRRRPERRWAARPPFSGRAAQRTGSAPPAMLRRWRRSTARAHASRVWRWLNLILPRSSTLMITTSSLSPIATTSATFST